MPRRALLLAGLTGLLALTWTVLAPAQDAKGARVAGRLTRIEAKALTVSSTADGAETATVLNIGEKTRYSRDGDKTSYPAKFEDLQVGQSVRVYYNAVDNVIGVVCIERAPAPAPATTK